MPAMPQSFEDKVRDTIGSLTLQVLQLQTQVEALQARVAELTPKPAETPPEGAT